MLTETEAIVLKQVKISGGRRMLVLFSKKFGKISAGTSLNERGKGKNALALRPFTFGRYELNKSGDTYHINGGDVIKSHYSLGEDVEKYASSSYIMEFTERLLPEDAPALSLFLLLSDFLDLMERRTKKHETLVLAYLIKALKYSGSEPNLTSCVSCGSQEGLTEFDIAAGGAICHACKPTFQMNERLRYEIDFDIVNIIRYIMASPLTSLERLALEDRTTIHLRKILRDYYSYHLDISGLRSEGFLEDHYEPIKPRIVK